METLSKVALNYLLVLADLNVEANNARNVNKQVLNSLRSFINRENYLTSIGYPIIGKGSSRKVFFINQRKVLKLAINDAGIAQNRVEFGLLTSLNSNFLPKPFDKAPDDSWIEVELTRPIKSKLEFEQHVGVSHKDYVKFLEQLEAGIDPVSIIDYHIKSIEDNISYKEGLKKNKYNSGRQFDFISKSIQGSVREIEKVEAVKSKVIGLLQTILDTGSVFAKEMSEVDHYGVTSSGKIVIIDVGFSTEVSDFFYASSDPGLSPEDKTKAPSQLARENEVVPYTYEPNPEKILPKEILEKYNPDFKSKDPKNVIPNLESKLSEIESEVRAIAANGTFESIQNYIDTKLNKYYKDGVLNNLKHDQFLNYLVNAAFDKQEQELMQDQAAQ